jgi:hypothetical protein
VHFYIFFIQMALFEVISRYLTFFCVVCICTLCDDDAICFLFFFCYFRQTSRELLFYFFGGSCRIFILFRLTFIFCDICIFFINDVCVLIKLSLFFFVFLIIICFSFLNHNTNIFQFTINFIIFPQIFLFC